MQTSPFLIERIRGMDERYTPVDSGAVLQLRDLTWDPQDIWVDAGGSRLLVDYDENNPYNGEGIITSIHYFSQRTGGKQWLLYETATGYMRVFNGSGRSTTPWLNLVYRDGSTVNDRAAMSHPWAGSASATWGERMYIVNGVNAPVVYDGETVDVMGWSAIPAAPEAYAAGQVSNFLDGWAAAAAMVGGAQTFALSYMGLGPYDVTAGGTNFDCAYRYKVSFVNERGQESPLSEASSTVLFTNVAGAGGAAGAKIVRVTVPVGGANTVARRVYRTQNLKDSSGNFVLGRADQFFFLREIGDNLIDAFEDGTDDSLLGSLVDESALGLMPDGIRYIAPFAGSMFVAGPSATSVFYSAPGYPEVFPPNNIINIGDAHLGPITGLFPTRDSLVVFKQRGIYLIKIDASRNFYVLTLTREYGCAAPKSIVDVPNVGLCFMSASDIYALTGTLESDNRATSVQRLSTPIPLQMAKINRSAMANVRVAINHRDKEVWWGIPTIGSATIDRVLVYHYEVGAWSFREDFPISCMLSTADDRQYLIYGSYDTANAPGLYVYSRGWDDKNGTAIAPLLQTTHMDLGRKGLRTIAPRDFMLRCGGHGNNKLTLNYAFNRKPLNALTTTETSALAKVAQLPQSPFAVYGTATYTTTGTTANADGTYSVWSPVRAITQRWPISQVKGGPILDMSVTITPVDRHVTFEGFDLETAPLDGKPLDTASGTGAR